MGSVGPAGTAEYASCTIALLVVLSPVWSRRTYYDYADYLGEIAGRQLARV
jgi:hypothetical protein